MDGNTSFGPIKCHRLVLDRMEFFHRFLEHEPPITKATIDGISCKTFLHVLGYAYTDNWEIFDPMFIHPITDLSRNSEMTGDGSAQKIDVHDETIHNPDIDAELLREYQLHQISIIDAALKLEFNDLIETMTIRSQDGNNIFDMFDCQGEPCSMLNYEKYSPEVFRELVRRIYEGLSVAGRAKFLYEEYRLRLVTYTINAIKTEDKAKTSRFYHLAFEAFPEFVMDLIRGPNRVHYQGNLERSDRWVTV